MPRKGRLEMFLFLRGSLLNTSGNALAAASQWLIIILCARVLGAEVMGQYAYVLAMVSPIFLLGGMNMRQMISSLPDDDYHPGNLLRLQRAGVFVAVIASLCAALAFLGRDWTGYVTLVPLLVAIRAVDTTAEGRYGFYQRGERPAEIALRKGTRALAIVAAFIVGCYAGRLDIALLGVLVASALVFVGLERLPVEPLTGSGPDHEASWKPLFRIGLLSGCAAAVDASIVAIPRLYLGPDENLEAVAVFTALVQIPAVLAIVVGGLGQSLIPRLRLSESRRSFVKVLGGSHLLVLALGLLGVGAAATVGDRAVEILYGAEFAGRGEDLVRVMIGGVLWYLAGMNGCAIQARGHYHLHLLSTSSAALTALLVLYFGRADIGTAITAYAAAMGVRFLVSGVVVAWDIGRHDRKSALAA